MSTPVPLAEKRRPQTLQSVVGQGHLTGPQGLLTRLVQAGSPQSLILWGPPGCGKTTLARLYAQAFKADFIQLSAVLAGVADIRAVVEGAKSAQNLGRLTVLFVDEIHRFTKSQQDAFLPHVESGLLVLVGATTENPSFELNNALLSRAQVLTLNPLNETALEEILIQTESSLGHPLPVTPEGRAWLVAQSHGDARSLLNRVEVLLATTPSGQTQTPEGLAALLGTGAAFYDKNAEWHYNLISALHKSVRGSDPHAALYYLARMLEGGEDGLYLARRLVRMAAEDIGLADPQALPLAIAAQQAYHTMGSPEGDLALAETAVYLALAPKSVAVYKAWGQARGLAKATSHVAPPAHILNAPTNLMKSLGYGGDYQYDPDQPDSFSGQNYWPQGVDPQTFYHPVERGFEREMLKRLNYFQSLRHKKQAQ